MGAAAVGVTGEILCTTFFARTGMRTRAFMRYSAHVSGGTPRSQRSSRGCAASADPGTAHTTHRQRRTTRFAGARDRASEAAAGQAASHAVWAEVGEAGAADRAVGAAAGGTGIEAQRARAQRQPGSGQRRFNASAAKPTRRALPDHLPRQTRRHEPKETVCPECRANCAS